MCENLLLCTSCKILQGKQYYCIITLMVPLTAALHPCHMYAGYIYYCQNQTIIVWQTRGGTDRYCVRFCCAQNINLLILQVQENNIGIYHTAGESTPTMLVLSIPVNQTKEATTTAAAAAAAMVWCGVVWCGVRICCALLVKCCL